jgi:hypothetical protein
MRRAERPADLYSVGTAVRRAVLLSAGLVAVAAVAFLFGLMVAVL